MRRIAPLIALLGLAGCAELGLGTPTHTRSGSDAPQKTAQPKGQPGQPQIALSKTRGARGQAIPVTATLRTGGQRIAGTQNDIGFDARQAGIAAQANGKPDCRANPAIGKEGTAFSFLPKGCRPPACKQVRALVLSLSDVAPIPDGAVLYTCTVTIAANAAPGSQGLSANRVGFSSPAGEAIQGGVVNGSILIQ